MNILLTYDVDTTDKEGQRRLRKVAKVCVDYGQRVQNSVCELDLTGAQLATIKGVLKDIIAPTLDSIRIYHLGNNNNKRIEVIGVETSFNIQETIII